MVVKDPGYPLHVVGVAQQNVAGDTIQDTACGCAVEVVRIAAGHVVVPAMEVPAEPHQLGSPGIGPRQPKGHQRRLGSRGGESDPFGGWDHAGYEFGPLDLLLMAGAEMGPPVERGMHRSHHGGMIVAEDQGTVAPEVIDIFVAIDIPFHRT